MSYKSLLEAATNASGSKINNCLAIEDSINDSITASLSLIKKKLSTDM